MRQVFIGVDVGTGSARAGVFDADGQLLASARHAIRIWHEPGDVVEQSSDDIWNACVRCVREAMAASGVEAETVAGIGFDATCSLVVLGSGDRPLPVGSHGDASRNIIVWMDHRAIGQAERINATGDEVLRYVGGTISPEMQMPKLLWLKENLPGTFNAAAHFFDLADFLTYRATGSTARSTCTVTCKWTYLAHEGRWSPSFFERIGLGDLNDDGHPRIGSEIVEPGTALGQGLTTDAAAELGLRPGTAVGASLIDAHAGGVGTVGARGEDGAAPLEGRIAYIMGTSACIMASTADPRFVPGVWGPYFSAMLPGVWLNEGGQSASGAGIDHLMRCHPAHAEAAAAAEAAGLGLLEHLERRVLARVADPSQAARLAQHLHVLPEFLGNRSPHADPGARAVIAGLDLGDDVGDLERLFVAGMCGLAYGLAEVVDVMRGQGIESRTIVISGGASRSRLVRHIVADATGLAVALPSTAEPVTLGAAMLGAVAAGAHSGLPDAMSAMSGLGEVVTPAGPEIAAFHAAKRRVHVLMQGLDRESRSIMSTAARA
jgi:D-ribulokinase